jgi:hypothetical protein
MKLRIHGNSIRLRLRRSEIEAFGRKGKLEEKLDIGAGTLRYALDSYDGDKVQVDFDCGELLIHVPAAQASAWVNGEEVGIYEKTPTAEVILEKEFRRTSQRTEFDEDLYPNPRAGKHLEQIQAIHQ